LFGSSAGTSAGDPQKTRTIPEEKPNQSAFTPMTNPPFYAKFAKSAKSVMLFGNSSLTTIDLFLAAGSILVTRAGCFSKIHFLIFKNNFMAKFNKGILGGFSGTVGTVVGGNWNGIDYMRSRPTIRNSNPSTAQQVQKAKFAVAAQFLSSMKTLLMISFKDFGKKMTGHNSALSYTLKNAVKGVFPDFEIDYNLARIARGSLPNGSSVAAAATDPGKISFKWTDNTGTGIAKATDKAILVAYHAASKTATYTIGSAVRSAGLSVLDVSGLKGEDVETWIAFISDNGKDVSSSVYTGKLTVA
jgi:hypothetical protein